MKTLATFWLPGFFLLLFVPQAQAETQASKWLQLDADSKERLRHLIQSDVESRRGFSTVAEAQLNTALVAAERQRENTAYKAAIDAATNEFRRTKKRSDDLTARFQTASYDFEETRKNYDNIKAGIANIDNSIARYKEDSNAQREALTKWLKTTKQGETIVAVIYNRGFMDSAHKLERLADQASAPLMAEHMGTYIKSFTNVINNVLTGDFIRAVEEGTAKWNREEPLRIALTKGAQGTAYLRIKRYELYPFQAPDAENIKPKPVDREIRAFTMTSMKDLESFLARNHYPAENYDLRRVAGMIRDTDLANRQAEANQREQLISFKERITYLEQKIASARSDRASLLSILDDKKDRIAKMTTELELLRLKKESAELDFQNAQALLLEKKRVHESIIIKTSLVTVKRSETPAEASAEAVLEELKDVLNDARMQHYSSTTDVAEGKLVDESERQAITEAKIVAVRSLAFINEGDSIRVKMAFRVRTVLDAKDVTSSVVRRPAKPLVAATAIRPKKRQAVTTPSAGKKSVSKLRSKSKSSAIVVLKRGSQPAIRTTPSVSAKALDFLFELVDVSKVKKDLTFFVKATNKAGYIQYLAFFDETSGYARSSISASAIRPKEVSQVYLRQGNKKIAAADAYRGVPVESGASLTVELTFKAAAPGNAIVSRLNLIPTVGTRSILRIYSWRSEEVPFKNIRIP